MTQENQVANNRRCYHCGTRARNTSQQIVSGFKVRLCLDCWCELIDYLDGFCAMRPDYFLPRLR
jgi:hypothetical protein